MVFDLKDFLSTEEHLPWCIGEYVFCGAQEHNDNVMRLTYRSVDFGTFIISIWKNGEDAPAKVNSPQMDDAIETGLFGIKKKIQKGIVYKVRYDYENEIFSLPGDEEPTFISTGLTYYQKKKNVCLMTTRIFQRGDYGYYHQLKFSCLHGQQGMEKQMEDFMKGWLKFIKEKKPAEEGLLRVNEAS